VSLFRLFRIVLLLSVLFVIVVGTWMTERRLAEWERPILVTVYPIAADGSAVSRQFVEEMDASYFDDINRFFAREARPYGFTVTPAFRFQVSEPLDELPPPIPGLFETVPIAIWSLKMRWWAWMRDWRDGLVSGDIQMFLLFQDAERDGEVNISVGMRKGRYGIVKAYADPELRNRNLIIFTHEMLHVLGATDKYVLSTREPVFPEGYADPRQNPLFPQTRAEIMGGRIPLSATRSTVPESLAQCRIGQVTAEEIGFFNRLSDYR
jgi:hypothetical protein